MAGGSNRRNRQSIGKARRANGGARGGGEATTRGIVACFLCESVHTSKPPTPPPWNDLDLALVIIVNLPNHPFLLLISPITFEHLPGSKTYPPLRSIAKPGPHLDASNIALRVRSPNASLTRQQTADKPRRRGSGASKQTEAIGRTAIDRPASRSHTR